MIVTVYLQVSFLFSIKYLNTEPNHDDDDNDDDDDDDDNTLLSDVRLSLKYFLHHITEKTKTKTRDKDTLN